MLVGLMIALLCLVFLLYYTTTYSMYYQGGVLCRVVSCTCICICTCYFFGVLLYRDAVWYLVLLNLLVRLAIIFAYYCIVMYCLTVMVEILYSTCYFWGLYHCIVMILVQLQYYWYCCCGRNFVLAIILAYYCIVMLWL